MPKVLNIKSELLAQIKQALQHENNLKYLKFKR